MIAARSNFGTVRAPGTQTRFTFRAPAAENEAAESGADTHPLILYERQIDNRVDVPDDLPLTDPLVLKAQRLLNKRKRDSGGLIPAPAGGLHIHTSRSLHDRTLRIMQALMTAFERRGFP